MCPIDDFLSRTSQALNYKAARKRDIHNLRNWTSDFGCISREELAYLWKDDLMAVGPSEPDNFLEMLANLTEDCIIHICGWVGKVSSVHETKCACPLRFL